MSAINDIICNIKLPKMLNIEQKFPREKLEDVKGRIREQLSQSKIESRIRPGMKIAIGAGSRGISNYAKTIRELVVFLQEKGAEPFIFAAMGSHGGATCEGQEEILSGYGITEDEMGCPVKIGIETAVIGKTKENYPVNIDKYAAEADGIIIVNRVKPHTAFRGKYESGLLKMLAIGVAKQVGADFCHSKGSQALEYMIPLFGKAIIENSNVMFGLALIENAYDETIDIIALTDEEIINEEPNLLLRAKKLMPRIYVHEADILIVDEIGKNISGDGMDPNITGTFSNSSVTGGLKSKRTVVLDMTDESHGNGVGLGMADCSTMKAFNKFSREKSYPNVLTSLVPAVVKVPLIFDNDKQAIQAAIKMCPDIDLNNVRVVRIKNTLEMSKIQISETLIDTVSNHPNVEILDDAKDMIFDEEGNLL